ncbi:hypothetical protein [Saccharothrix deserti]|nr:hypothetical protein [Saccharothrix deserti]
MTGPQLTTVLRAPSVSWTRASSRTRRRAARAWSAAAAVRACLHLSPK